MLLRRALIAIAVVTFLVLIATSSATAISGTYGRLNLPFVSGVTHTVTGTHDRAGGRHALDFNMTLELVFAMYGGRVVYDGTTVGGKMLVIDHGDNFCSVYLHLKHTDQVSVGSLVWKGRPIAQSGNGDGAYAYHLHVAVNQKNSNGSCTPIYHSNEIAMIFKEKPGVELVYNDKVTSQNTMRLSPYRFPFTGGPSSYLYQDQNYGRLNLQVCADSISGKEVWVIVSRPGKEWFYSRQIPSGTRCTTFYDLDGAGPLLKNTTYTTRAGLGAWPDQSWGVPCHSATGGYGLCDKLTTPP
jgi:hypothetical protein